jgi:hypothetical protein
MPSLGKSRRVHRIITEFVKPNRLASMVLDCGLIRYNLVLHPAKVGRLPTTFEMKAIVSAIDEITFNFSCRRARDAKPDRVV